MSEPAVHPCTSCGATPALWGYRLPGLRRDLPKGRTGYRWACDACKPETEARWREATA